MTNLDALETGLAVASLRAATPLLWALLGETLDQRAGIVNLGLEGQMLVGAATAFGVTASTESAWIGLVAGALAGAVLSALHALLCLRFRANQFVSGISVWMIGFGISSYLGQKLVGQSITGFSDLAATALGRAVPVVATLTPPTLLALGLTLVTGAVLYHTRPGLAVRAVGESRACAAAAGLRVNRVQALSVLVGGLYSGAGGAVLSIDYAQTWAEGMTQGRGLVAVGLVIVARWNPYLALPTALVFGGAETLVLRLQSAGSEASAHLLHLLPYGVALGVLVASCLTRAVGVAPAELRTVLDR
jgi:general nucleoside transport system permease protein